MNGLFIFIICQTTIIAGVILCYSMQFWRKDTTIFLIIQDNIKNMLKKNLISY